MKRRELTAFRPTALAAALVTLLSAPAAWALNSVPVAVSEAYLGAASPDKLAAALVGLRPIIAELPLITPPGPCWYCWSGLVFTRVDPGVTTIITVINTLILSSASIEEFWIIDDSDLAVLGQPALLANTRLTLGGSFATARDFVIGSPAYTPDYRPAFQFDFAQPLDAQGHPVGPPPPTRPYQAGPGYINTNGYDLKITGVITAHQKLYKEGEGTLWLAGVNVWNAPLVVVAGTLQGDATSLDSDIANLGRVEFKQLANGVYRHVLSGSGDLLKTGAGVLTVTGELRQAGGTNVAEGTLALADWGKLADGAPLQISAGGTLDLTGVWTGPVLHSLAGEGKVILGRRGLMLDIASEHASFAGNISGDGPLSVKGHGYTLNGMNSFTGGLNIIGTTLNVSRADSLGNGEVRLDGATLRLFAPIQASQTLRVDNAGRLDSNGHDASWSGDIAGGGQWVKTGDAVLTLLSANSFTGEISVAQGTLKLAGDGGLDNASRLVVDGTLDLTQANQARRIHLLSGIGTLSLGAAGVMLGPEGHVQSSFSGVITGIGGITKVGTGEQALYGANSYAGVSLVQAGTLRVAPQSLGNRVVNNASVAFDQYGGLGNIAAWSGDMSGTGQLIKSGDGVLWLRGHNNYSGGTLVESGVLIGNTDSLQGNIETRAGLAFYQVVNGSYGGQISGSGTLMSYGPGALTLAGNNMHTGGTAFSNTLRIGKDVNLGGPQSGLLIAGGTLVALDNLGLNRHVALGEAGARFDSNGFNITLNGRVDGPGGVTKLGEGVLDLAGEHGFTGPTRVAQGGLRVNGSVLGDVQVLDGAWFETNGRIAGNLLVARGALFSAGNVPGTVVVEGDFSAAGELLVEIAGRDVRDFVQVGGVANLAGAHIHLVLIEDTLPGDLLGISLLSAAGGIVGLSSASLQFDSGLSGYRLAQVGNSLQLAAVPEPETWAMLLAGLGLLGWRRWKTLA